VSLIRKCLSYTVESILSVGQYFQVIMWVSWYNTRGGVAEWVRVDSKDLKQETLPSLLSTGWFQEGIRAW